MNKYYKENIGYKEDIPNFIRSILIPQCEYYFETKNMKGLNKFLKLIGSDKRHISKYLYDNQK